MRATLTNSIPIRINMREVRVSVGDHADFEAIERALNPRTAPITVRIDQGIPKQMIGRLTVIN